MKRFIRKIINWRTYPVWMILIATLIGLIPLLLLNSIDLFFICVGTGISAAVVQCAIMQNNIQKDNIKLQLFDKRYSVYEVILDSRALIKRNDWGRHILKKGNNISSEILEMEERLDKATKLSTVLFDLDVLDKIIEINNQYCEVANAYKNLLVKGNSLFTSKEDHQNFTFLLSKYLMSNETEADVKEYTNKLKESYPKIYVLINEYSAQCQLYISKIEDSKILSRLAKDIIISDLDK